MANSYKSNYVPFLFAAQQKSQFNSPFHVLYQGNFKSGEFHPDLFWMYQLSFDYHFWYQTDNGQWTNKHGYNSFSQLLDYDIPTNNSSSGWKINPNLSQYYDSDLLYYRITE